MTESFLDSFSERTFWLGAAAFIITWIITAAHLISGNEGFPWQKTSFKISASIFIVLITSSIISGNILQSIARREIIAFTKGSKLQQVVLYNIHCRIIQNQYFSNALSHLNYSSPHGSRFVLKEYKMAILNKDTVARFKLVQNNYDTTLYQIFYLNYSTTSSNAIGLAKIKYSLTSQCR